MASFLARIGIAIVRRVRILDPDRILEGPRVSGLSVLSYSLIGLICSVCLLSGIIGTVYVYVCSNRGGGSVVRLRLVDCLAFAVPIAAIALLIAYSLVAVFVP